MWKPVVLLLLASACTTVTATVQDRDRVVIDGAERPLNNSPLESLRSETHLEIPQSEIWSTGNHRGYVAHWALRSGVLYLDRVVIQKSRQENRPRENRKPTRAEFEAYFASIYDYDALEEAFGHPGPVLAHWVTETLVVEPEYGSDQPYVLVRVESGQVRCTRSLKQADFESFEEILHEEFLRSPAYLVPLEQAKLEVAAAGGEWSDDDEFDSRFWQSPMDVVIAAQPPGCG